MCHNINVDYTKATGYRAYKVKKIGITRVFTCMLCGYKTTDMKDMDKHKCKEVKKK